MSEKQQKNLNKQITKIPDIPEGLRNFLKKQIKKLKELEFEKLKDHFSKLEEFEKVYNRYFKLFYLTYIANAYRTIKLKRCQMTK